MMKLSGLFCTFVLCVAFLEDAQGAKCRKAKLVKSSFSFKSQRYPALKPKYKCGVAMYVFRAAKGQVLTVSCPVFKVSCPNAVAAAGRRICDSDDQFPTITSSSNYLTVTVYGKGNKKRKTLKNLKFLCRVTAHARIITTTTTPTTTTTTTSSTTTVSAATTSNATTTLTTTAATTTSTIDRNTTESPSCVCGTRALHSKIVGGENALPKEFPYQAAMIRRTNGNLYFVCGGSLISKQWVVTAAHCKMALQDYVILGRHQLSVASEHEEFMKIIEVRRHPSYSTRTGRFDITLLKVEREVSYSEFIRPICLPEKFQSNGLVGERVQISGWGRIAGNGPTSDILQKATEQVISNSVCKRYFKNIYTENVCSYNRGTSACNGDSGGPLAYHTDGRTYLIGVVSYGRKGCPSTGVPAVFTRVAVSNVLKWVKQIAGNPCTPP